MSLKDVLLFPARVVQHFWIVFLFIGGYTFVVHGIPYLLDNTDTGKSLIAAAHEDADLSDKQNNIVRTSTDCKELQNTLLQLTSSDANAQSWFPDSSDINLKIGQERYALLECHN